jgi:hypothetical protein
LSSDIQDTRRLADDLNSHLQSLDEKEEMAYLIWKRERIAKCKSWFFPVFACYEKLIISRSRLFDGYHYLKQRSFPLLSDVCEISDFVTVGVLSEASPFEGFSIKEYVYGNYEDLRKGENPLLHHIRVNKPLRKRRLC